jgi:hypothetical protein
LNDANPFSGIVDFEENFDVFSADVNAAKVTVVKY